MQKKSVLEQSKSLYATFGTLKNKYGGYKFFDYIDDGILSDNLEKNIVASIFKFLKGANESLLKLKCVKDLTYKRFICGLLRDHYFKSVEQYKFEYKIESRLKNFIATRCKEIIIETIK